mgnify:CR=1 FL=1
MEDKKKLIIITSIIAVGIPLFAISTQTILKKARDDYYKIQKQQIEAEKAKERAEKEQRLAQEKAEREKQIQQEKEEKEKRITEERNERRQKAAEQKLQRDQDKQDRQDKREKVKGKRGKFFYLLLFCYSSLSLGALFTLHFSLFTTKAELVPPNPKELERKALIGRSWVWVMIFSFWESSSKRSILILGAIKSCCIIRIEYTSSLAPAIQHSCPVMDLVELTGVWLPNSW